MKSMKYRVRCNKARLGKPRVAFGKNMLLQEDRRRTLMLLLRRDGTERVRYIKSAVAEATVKTDVTSFVAKYRRRYVSTLANTVYFLSFIDLTDGPVVVETPPGVLHFKTDCAIIDDTTIFSTARLAASGCFEGYDVVVCPDGERSATGHGLTLQQPIRAERADQLFGSGLQKDTKKVKQSQQRVL